VSEWGSEGRPLWKLGHRARHLSDELLVLVLEAYREGRRDGVQWFAGELTTRLAAMESEGERSHRRLGPEGVERLEATYGSASGSPVVAAHFGSAAMTLADVRAIMRRLRGGQT